MCGITGILDTSGQSRLDLAVLERMTAALAHRGPDDQATYHDEHVGLGFRRLSIVDLAGGQQPMTNEDHSLVLVCNGEIFNHIELRRELEARGHVFRTRSDVEVILHLYEDEGPDLLARLNGQFAFVLYDRNRRRVFAARDPFGIAPLFYTCAGGFFLFGSEIKSLLPHPAVQRAVDLVGLDQVFTFPGLVSPRTMFAGIHSLPAGHFLLVGGDAGPEPRVSTYWDMVYPTVDEPESDLSEAEWVAALTESLKQAVRYRLRADVPVGFYLSGGLDSSLIAALIHDVDPDAERHSFSIDFPEKVISEGRYQRQMAQQLRSIHHERLFEREHMVERLQRAIHHAECPLKETFDTAALALAESVRQADIKVVLAGQGADELFGGYIGYRFDRLKREKQSKLDASTILENKVRQRLWGDPGFLYERPYHAFHKECTALYSARVREQLAGSSCIDAPVVPHERVQRRDSFHQRSYVDLKVRLQDHLLGDHGDRMTFAHSVEARYPFLDPAVVDLARRMPPSLKLKDYDEKYIVKRVAEPFLPREIIEREKFGFTAPGSPYLLQAKVDYVQDLLSYDRIARQGYFDPDAVEALKQRFSVPGFRLNVPFDSDPLITVITMGIFLEQFEMPGL